MIISDKFEFAFIHIPKCAGSTVRGALEQYDDRWSVRYTGHRSNGNVVQPDLSHCEGWGLVDMAHLPLALLRRFFPGELEALRAYLAIAIVRDPHRRLVSSVSQRILFYGSGPVRRIDARRFEELFAKTLDEVGNKMEDDSILPHDMVHFQPQGDFIELDGERIANAVFPISRLDLCEAFIADHWRNKGAEAPRFANERAGRSVVYRSDKVRALVEAGRPLIDRIKPIIPVGMISLARQAFHIDRDERFGHLANSEMVRSFVQDHYAQDAEIWMRTSRDYAD